MEIEAALDELQRIIRDHYPSASFEVALGDDPAGIYLVVTVDVDNTDDVVDIYIERLLALQVEEGLPIYVIPRSGV